MIASTEEAQWVFRPWAFRIASRTAFRWLKAKRRWRTEPLDEMTLRPIPMKCQPAYELLRELDYIEGISPASRAVLVLHFQEELPLTEVAAILEIPLGTVKSRLAYGLNALRRYLKP